MVRTSESRAISIHRFIESRPAKRRAAALLAHLALEVGLDVGEEQVARRPCDSSESLGWNSPNTLSWVSSVWAMFMSYS